MMLTIEATYQNGILKPIAPLPLRELEKVQVTVQSQGSVAQHTAGIVPWTGDPELLERFAIDPAFDPQES